MSDEPPGHQDQEARIVPGLWWVARGILAPIIRLVFRLRVVGADNIPEHGPTLFVANHISMWDPPMIGFALARRHVYFMAKSELFAVPGLGWAIRRLGAFPVERGGADRSAIRTARKVLARGDALLMFPEGTRSSGGRMGEAWPGAGALALANGVHVVPVAIDGSNRRVGPVRVAFGAPIDLSDLPPASRGERSQLAADRMMTAVGALRRPVHGGAT
jgi:1-acyl-sn-glycerol-3-phosphate acyltransferase